MQETLSRRSFLEIGGIGAAVAASTALFGCTPTNEPGKSEEKVEEESGKAIYRSLSSELNPQDDMTEFRKNSGDVSQLFTSWKMGNMEIKNRFVKSAAGSGYKNGGWDVFTEYYTRIAQGGTGMVWIENFFHILSPYTNRLKKDVSEIDTLYDVKGLIDSVHNAGAKIGTQIDTMASTYMSTVKARIGDYYAEGITDEEIDWLVDRYVASGIKMHDLGFDAYELNCAGDNVPQWFLSAARNHREDEYGAQTYENRTRFICRVIKGIQDACGKDWPIQVLINGIEENDESLGQNYDLNTVEDGIEIAKYLEAAGIASLHVRLGPLHKHVCQFMSDLYFSTRGCIGSTGFGAQFDFDRHFQGKLIANHGGVGMMLNVAAQYKKALSIPVGTVTYMDPAFAPDFFNKAIADGMVDFLIMNRPLNLDNDYVTKLKENRIDEIRPCNRCCHCFNDTTKESNVLMGGYGTSLACRWDAARNLIGNGRGLPGNWDPDPASDPTKKIMIIGAGPAGMEAARICGERGYKNVTLYDKKSSIGGLLNFAEVIKGTHERLSETVAWYKKQLESYGVNVVTGKEVDAEFVKAEMPDVVIVAVGGKRQETTFQSNGATTVVSIEDIANKEIGEKVVILGSNAQATDVAFYLIEQGKQITIVTSDEASLISKGQSLWVKTFSTPMLYARGTKVFDEASIKKVQDGQVTVATKGGAEVSIACDTLIDARDMVENKTLANSLSTFDVHTIGDCDSPYNIQYAVRAGNWLARTI